MTCASTLEAAAVALLTGEDPAEDVQEHLDECTSCRAEVDLLRPLTALLGDAAADGVLDDMPAPDDALLERLLGSAAEERASRRRRVYRAVAGIAAALVLVVSGGVWIAGRDGGASGLSATGIHATATDAGTGVWGDVRLSPSDWGSDLSMAVNGVEEGTQCSVVVVTSDGARQTAATWWASYDGTATVQGNVAAAPDSVDRVELVDDSSGEVLLRVQVAA